MTFDADLSIAQVALIPLIIGTIQAAKRFAPNAHDNVWFGLSLFLGVGFQALAYLAFEGVPTSFPEILSLCVMGLAFGLASGKAYDQSKGG